MVIIKLYNKLFNKIKILNYKLFLKIFNFANTNNFTKLITKNMAILLPNIFFILYFIGIIYMCYITFFLKNNSINDFYNFEQYKQYINLIKYIIVPVTALVISNIIRKIVNAHRPFENKDLNIKPLIYHKGGSSMPSNHSTSAMVISMALIFICEIITPYILILAFITGLSRVMAGVHYPLDVIVGLSLGAFVGIVGFF